MLNLEEVFEKHKEEFLKFERIESPAHAVPDICAFLLLADLDVLQRASGGESRGKQMDIVACAEHDQIWLNANCCELAEIATEEQIIYLARCGVMYESDTESLSMFV